ncbi:hypothetical protein ACP4OV_014435 [Aristida adscensionis]
MPDDLQLQLHRLTRLYKSTRHPFPRTFYYFLDALASKLFLPPLLLLSLQRVHLSPTYTASFGSWLRFFLAHPSSCISAASAHILIASVVAPSMAAASLSSRRRRLWFPVLLVVLLVVAVFPQRSSCRPLPPSGSNGAGHEAAPSLPAGERFTAAAAAERSGYKWLLDMKPRGRAPPSAPSKRTN